MSKLQDIRVALNNKYFERKSEVEGLLVSMIAKQHVLFIGEAGTGKSQLSAELGNIVDGSSYFQWLLSQFSTPEELFGVLSLKELEQGIYKRNTASKLPEAHFAFLDEIFKANSAILNSLLTLINERIFYNNGSPIQTPVMSIVGSSNEYPEEGEGLEALFDRFLLRYEVDYIKEEKSFISLLKGGNKVEIPTMTFEELAQAQQEATQVAIPDKVIEALAEIRQALKDEGIRPSDRRFVQSLSLLKARAYIENRKQVNLKDMELLKNSLWVTPEQMDITHEIVRDVSFDEDDKALEQRKGEVQDLINRLQDGKDVNQHLEIIQKLKVITSELEKLNLQDTQERDQLVKIIKNEVDGYVSQIIDF